MNTLVMPTGFNGFMKPYRTTELSPPEMQVIMGLMLASTMDPDGLRRKMLEMTAGSFLFQVAIKRLEAKHVEYDPAMLIMLLLRASNPAHAVVAAYTLSLMSLQPKEPFQDAMIRWFPEGLPDMSRFNELWELQKLTDEQRKENPSIMDNLIDVAPWPNEVAEAMKVAN